MANPQLVWQLSKGFFIRNNPVGTLMSSVSEGIHGLMTFQSKMKLLKYKFMLAQGQLDSMEGFISTSPSEVRGESFDRPF